MLVAYKEAIRSHSIVSSRRSFGQTVFLFMQFLACGFVLVGTKQIIIIIIVVIILHLGFMDDFTLSGEFNVVTADVINASEEF